jgi:hypothetical protein
LGGAVTIVESVGGEWIVGVLLDCTKEELGNFNDIVVSGEDVESNDGDNESGEEDEEENCCERGRGKIKRFGSDDFSSTREENGRITDIFPIGGLTSSEEKNICGVKRCSNGGDGGRSVILDDL